MIIRLMIIRLLSKMTYSIIDVHMEQKTKEPFHNLQQPHVGAVAVQRVFRRTEFIKFLENTLL